jgi:hypothetical protein
VPSWPCYCGYGCGPVVLQRIYRPPKINEDFQPSETIIFSAVGRCGILVADLLQGNYRELIGRDDKMFRACGTSISLRFEVGAVLESCFLDLINLDLSGPDTDLGHVKYGFQLEYFS